MNPTPYGQDVALAAFRHTVALWYVDQKTAADVVFAACDLLVSGVDGTTLRELAAIEIGCADTEVHAVLEAVLDELGLPNHPRESEAAQRAALVAMSSQVVSSAIAPRELTAWVHALFGHQGLDLAEHLADLDDVYDLREFAGDACDVVDADVIAEARRIVSRIENTPGP
jgi:hypothetical protein